MKKVKSLRKPASTWNTSTFHQSPLRELQLTVKLYLCLIKHRTTETYLGMKINTVHSLACPYMKLTSQLFAPTTFVQEPPPPPN
jgi:hypothetical protein